VGGREGGRVAERERDFIRKGIEEQHMSASRIAEHILL